MRAEENQKNIDIGLSVIFNGDYNTLIFNNELLEYPAGGMIAEYMRLAPSEIKPVIMSCGSIDDEATPDSMAIFLDDFYKKVSERFEPVNALMSTIEISNVIEEWFKAEREGQNDEYISTISKITSCEDINKYVFEDSEHKTIGKKTVCQMALSAYLVFAEIYINTNYTFNHILKWGEAKEDADEKTMQLLASLFTDMIDYQHIDFRIINTENGFESLYTIKTSMSLLTFEFAHWINKEIPFVKCTNCGHYFVPDGRSDQKYCNYQSPQNNNKTCREIGAQVAWANKEKNDVVTREYRKVYMRYKMLTRRHPENRLAQKKLDTLTDGMREWRKNLAEGTVTSNQFLSWLEQF